MPLYSKEVFGLDSNRSTSSETEYRTRFMSPRREDYAPHSALPKISNDRPLTRSRSFLSFDVDPNSTISESEYRLGFPNHHPKRPFVFHAQPSHVFDYVPMPVKSRTTPRFDSYRTLEKDTEYQERFPNYRQYIPVKELIPPHFSPQANVPSTTRIKSDRMKRSQYFHELISDSDKFNGGRRYVGNSEQRSAFQWPYHPNSAKSLSSMNIYGTIPTVHRETLKASN